MLLAMLNFSRYKILLKLALFVFILFSFSIEIASKNYNTDNASLLLEKAEEAKTSGHFQESIDLYQEYLKKFKPSLSEEEEYQIYLKLGLLYWNIGMLSDFVDYFQSAKSIAEKLGHEKQKRDIETALLIHDLYQESKTYRSIGDYPEACRALENAIELSRSIKSNEMELKCLRILGVTHLYATDYQNLRQRTEEALAIARSLNHKISEGRCLNNLGIYYEKIGNNYSKALNTYQEALAILREQNFPIEISNCLNNLGICYQSLGNYEKSLEYFHESYEIDKKIGDEVILSKVLNNIGENYRLKGLISHKEEDFNQALEYFTQALELAEKIEFTSSQIYALNNIGSIYTDMFKYGEALTYFHSALDLAESINDIESQGMLLNNIGIVHHNQGNFENSSEYFQKAIDLAVGIENDKILWEAFFEMGKNYAKQGEYNKALEKYKSSIDVIENIRSSIILEELKASYFGTDKRLEAYYSIIDLLVFLNENYPQKKYDREAFNYLERAKARSFLDSLEASRIDVIFGIDVRLLNREKELMKNISNIYTRLLDNGISAEDKENIQTTLSQYEDELESLKREIRYNNPSYSNLYPDIITIEEAQKKLLDNNTAVFAYMIGNEHSLAFVVTKKKLKIFRLPAKEKFITLVTSYLKVISDKDNNNFKLGNELFHQLVLPGLEKNIKKIIFIPAEILNALPFETLVSDKNHWMIEDYKISYAPSITSLREIIDRNRSNHRRRPKDILAVGDPNFGDLEKDNINNNIFNDFYIQSDLQFFRLKYSGVETDRISSLFSKEKSDILLREKATEENVKKHDLLDYKILHFATHSLIDDKMPGRSSIMLVLDDDPSEDGFLQMREIYNLKLNADLVTLSACHTGGGQLIKGEGIEGLNRAFFYAGTSSVIMSLWSVNDQATYQLMERFYTHLRSSQPISQALQRAKLEMIHSDVLSHPYYWAGFIVSGNSNKVIFIHPVRQYAPLVLSIVLIGGILAFVFRKKNNRD